MNIYNGNIPFYNETFNNSEMNLGNPKIDAYIVDTEQTHGAVLVCPGGGYNHLATGHEGKDTAEWLNSIGYSAFVLHYRVSPYTYPSMYGDVYRAMKYIRFNSQSWNIDPYKIGIMGYSAGGHLAALLSTKQDKVYDIDDDIEGASARPDFSILCYPVISFTNYAHEGSRKNFLGVEHSNFALNEIKKVEFSNELRVDENTPPTFIWHTAEDASVLVENTLIYGMSLSKHKVPFKMEIFPHGGHGLGLAKEDKLISNWARSCEEWLSNLI